MDNKTIVVLGSKDLCKKLGEKGTVSDLELYNKLKDPKTYTFVAPRNYPEKIIPTIEAIALGDIAILYAKEINAELGELILALDSSDKKLGILILGNELTADMILPLIKGTVVEKYAICKDDSSEIMAKIDEIEPNLPESPKIIVIDHFFNVKGIGTVILGMVKSGHIRILDKMEILPDKIETMVRSIQMHDRDFKEAPVGARVGLALKGVDVKQLSRAQIITDGKDIKVTNEIKLDFTKYPFYKKELNENETYHMYVGLQGNPVRLIKKEGNILTFKSEKNFALYEKNIILVNLNEKGLRIIGKGKTVE
ncbi:MAG: hypothetical protein JXA43_02565 [Candidatus Diapherotrites archaeon]|nr:hypothetical protein [Candidatus Diapherotrites archaeon]